MRFRDTFKESRDELVAIRRFRYEIDLHRDRSHKQDIREILGTSFKPQYEDLLKFIPFEEIRLDGVEIGRGKFGSVMAAIWHRPSSLEYKEPVAIPVALKRILPYEKSSHGRDTQKFLHEASCNCFFLLNCVNSWTCHLVRLGERQLGG